MFSSLFGDLGPEPGPKRDAARGDVPEAGFAATAILESHTSDGDGHGASRHHTDLVVTGAAAGAIREHFAATRADMEFAARMITLVDPTGVWAGAVVKALSDATGRPIERLNLREQATLRTLATIERCVLLRRQDEPLKVYHAEARANGRDPGDIATALVERSHLAAVIVGPLAPHAVDDVLRQLADASRSSTWSCPNLLFMLPPDAAWIARKVAAVPWPATTRVMCIDEPLVSASAVWNAVLGVWNKVKHAAVVTPLTPPALLGLGDFPIKVAQLPGDASDTAYGTAELGRAAGEPLRAAPPPAITLRPSPALDLVRAQQTLIELAALDGVAVAALVDGRAGTLLASECRRDAPPDLASAAMAMAQATRAQRQAARALGVADRIEETVAVAGHHQIVTRVLQRQGDLVLMAVVERARGTLAQVRHRLLEAERALV